MKDDAPHSALLTELTSEKFKEDSEKYDRLAQKSSFEVVASISSVKDPKFARQYSHAYTTRLWTVKSLLESEFKTEWEPQKITLKRIAELCEGTQSAEAKRKSLSPGKSNKVHAGHEQRVAFHEDVSVAIIGTIFKHQPEKPSILLELNEDNPILPVVPKEKYTSDKDYLMFEDETTVVRLVPRKGCGIQVNDVVNGVVCALKGKPTIDGKFEISEVLWPTPKPAVWPTFKTPYDIEMVFISGLQLGRAIDPDKSVALELLFDYLMGLSGSSLEQDVKNAKQTKVFIIGNHLYKSSKHYVESFGPKLIEDAKTLDHMIDEIAATTEVFLLPGTSDPGQAMMPQPPLHKSVIPRSYRRESFHALPNPCEIKLNLSDMSDKPLELVLSSGENVADALRNCEIECPLEMAQRLLQWGHLCPTAPDTLALHPGCSDTSFILSSTLPHIFAVGNQKSFDSREWKGTKIVSIPSFWETATAVLLTKELEFVPLEFGVM